MAEAVFDREILGFWIETVFSDINGLRDEMNNRLTVLITGPVLPRALLLILDQICSTQGRAAQIGEYW